MIEPLRERKTIDIKGCVIGEGPSKAIISVMGANLQECLDVIEEGKANGVQMFEWRGDFNDSRRDPAAMVEQGKAISAAVPEHPLLFTFRSTSQGGQDSLSAEEYVALNKALIEAEILDIVDIETWIGDAYMIELINLAHKHGVYAMPSYHNFRGTPSVEWMVSLMEHMWDLGADIAKCANKVIHMRNGRISSVRTNEAPLSASELYIDDTSGLTPGQLRSRCRRLMMEHGLDMIVVDYLQLMGSDGKAESRQVEVSEISRSLKAIAQELKVPLVACAQLSRANEKRGGNSLRPMLSDLRDSGSIEQDADVVMFLHREAYYKRNDPDAQPDNIAEVIVAKQRNGPLGTVKLAFLGEYTLFDNLASEN